MLMHDILSFELKEAEFPDFSTGKISELTRIVPQDFDDSCQVYVIYTYFSKAFENLYPYLYYSLFYLQYTRVF